MKCEYCKEEIRGEYAKFDRISGAYLHSGPALTKITSGFPTLTPFNLKPDTREGQKDLPEDGKLCAQIYKLERVTQGETVVLDMVRLEDVASKK